MARTVYSKALELLRDSRSDLSLVGHPGEQRLIAFVGTRDELDALDYGPLFWTALETAAERLGGWLERDGDAGDVFYCEAAPADEEEEESE